MFARSTTIQALPSAIDQGLAYLREDVMPALLRMDGCVGFSALVDRASGRCIATSSWDSERAMRATAGAVQAVRDEGTKAFGGTIASVEEWEIALLHREHHTQEGTCVRVTRIQGDPSQVDRAVEIVRGTVIPRLEAMSGFGSCSFLVNRTTGLAVGTFAFDTRAALEASRAGATEVRTAVVQQLGATVEDVHEFELAIAHLRVPELV